MTIIYDEHGTAVIVECDWCDARIPIPNTAEERAGWTRGGYHGPDLRGRESHVFHGCPYHPTDAMMEARV